MKFRKNLVEVEAIQYDGDFWNFLEERRKPDWVLNGYRNGILNFKYYYDGDNRFELYIKTLEGDMHVSVKDWIIKGVNGELYPCKPDIFEKTYEPVESGDE